MQKSRKEILRQMLEFERGQVEKGMLGDSLLVCCHRGHRAILNEWMFELGEALNISNVTIASAINYMDRYLCRTQLKKTLLQLGALAATLLASKVYESKTLSAGCLATFADGVYSSHDILQMELHMSMVIDWKIQILTPFCFLDLFLPLYFKYIHIHESVLELAKSFIEVLMCEYEFIPYLPSDIAGACLLLAFDAAKYFEDDEGTLLWRQILEKSGRVGECRARATNVVCQILPQQLRSNFVVSPDCVEDTPDRDVSSLNLSDFEARNTLPKACSEHWL